MRPVFHNSGCGIACVAMVAGVSYGEAKAVMGNCEAAGTKIEELRRALLHFDVVTSESQPILRKDFRLFSFDAVLRGWAEDDWHWVVWYAAEKQLLDPYKPTPDFRCTSFIRVLR